MIRPKHALVIGVVALMAAVGLYLIKPSVGALVRAAIRCDSSAVKEILDTTPALAKKVDGNGDTALNLAVEAGCFDVVKLLLDAGADPHHNSPRLGMPLHFAAFSGNIKIVALLIDKGVDVNAQPQQYSFGEGTALHMAAGRGRTEVVTYLLQHGADVNAQGRLHENVTPLHNAAGMQRDEIGKIETIKALIQHGADTAAVTAGGLTPYDIARAAGHDDRLLEMLRSSKPSSTCQ